MYLLIIHYSRESRSELTTHEREGEEVVRWERLVLAVVGGDTGTLAPGAIRTVVVGRIISAIKWGSLPSSLNVAPSSSSL